jgi:Icc-related predicted phosphoesterase
MRLATRRLGHLEPMIVLSHVPPLGIGDVPTDAYHRGFKGYRWLLERLEPTLWLHGHTPLAATTNGSSQVGGTTVINVTGAVVIDLLPPTPETLAGTGALVALKAVLASRQGSRSPGASRPGPGPL